MSSWIDVAGVEELPSGTRRMTEGIAVFSLDGEYFAIADVCPHDGGALANGILEGEEIVCPRHGARFSIRTGAVLSPPAYEDIRTFPVCILQGRIKVDVE